MHDLSFAPELKTGFDFPLLNPANVKVFCSSITSLERPEYERTKQSVQAALRK